MSVALVHDWLNQQGGAEVVLEQLHAMYPDAPVYTSFYAQDLVDPAFRQLDVRTNWLQRLPGWRTRHQAFLPLYPLAFQSTRVRDAKVVVSNVSAFCKGIQTPPGSIHVCYCLTPTRFIWMPEAYLLREGYPAWLPRALAPLLWWMRRWDRAAAQKVTQFVAISQAVAERIRRFYGREAMVVHPPVHTTRFAPTTEVGDYFLVVSRLIPYKRIDLAVRACTEASLPLVVVGDGRDLHSLRRMAGPTVRFAGRVSDDEVRRHMARCRAFVFPGEEDFGIAPVEAQAAGRPVVAYAAGGALETVRDGETGVLFPEPTVPSLLQALERVTDMPIDAARLVRHAAQFDASVFRSKLRRAIELTVERARAPEAAT
ncbi:MAG: glycosyltransferase [Chloroflexi bacterium]|nr:glycosyltransferase [Chloroflexota bacterium]